MQITQGDALSEENLGTMGVAGATLFDIKKSWENPILMAMLRKTASTAEILVLHQRTHPAPEGQEGGR